MHIHTNNTHSVTHRDTTHACARAHTHILFVLIVPNRWSRPRKQPSNLNITYQHLDTLLKDHLHVLERLTTFDSPNHQKYLTHGVAIADIVSAFATLPVVSASATDCCSAALQLRFSFSKVATPDTGVVLGRAGVVLELGICDPGLSGGGCLGLDSFLFKILQCRFPEFQAFSHESIC